MRFKIQREVDLDTRAGDAWEAFREAAPDVVAWIEADPCNHLGRKEYGRWPKMHLMERLGGGLVAVCQRGIAEHDRDVPDAVQYTLYPGRTQMVCKHCMTATGYKYKRTTKDVERDPDKLQLLIFVAKDREEKQELTARWYKEKHKRGEWTENWDEYDPPSKSYRVWFEDVGPRCVPRFISMNLGWYEGSKSRGYDGRQRYKKRSWIRYRAFSGDWGSRPNRANLARRLERLHWLAGWGPPEWEKVKSREACVASIERFGRQTAIVGQHSGSVDYGIGATFGHYAWHRSPVEMPSCPFCEERPTHTDCPSKDKQARIDRSRLASIGWVDLGDDEFSKLMGGE